MYKNIPQKIKKPNLMVNFKKNGTLKFRYMQMTV